MRTDETISENLHSEKNAGRQADSRERRRRKPGGKLCGKVHGKLCSERGETLTETLCAVLIAALAAALLAVMSGTAARMNDRAIEYDNNLYQELAAAESKADESKLPVAGTVTVAVESAAGEDQTIVFDRISFYGEDGKLVSYGMEAEELPEEGE